MNKATGFLEYERKKGNEIPSKERLKHFHEFQEKPSDEALQKQGARCMDCGTPFCQTGNTIKRTASGCPISNLIPEWNELVYQGRWQEALERLRKTNNFAEFTGRVCPAPCEGSCVLGYIKSPVTIKQIERSIIDKGWQEGWIEPNPPKIRTGRRIAVVGSGPAGLSCADQLNQVGHTVTVYERADRIGGLLMYGIPNMKLEKSVVNRRIKLMETEGVVFKVNCEIGKDISFESLKENFDAIVFCVGATHPRDLAIEGRELKGIHFAMEYLTASTQHLLNTNFDNTLPALNAKGKNVIVIGGGDTGTDCVATALRQKCKNVTQLEIMPEPPKIRAKDNPWPEWPRTFLMDYGQKEATDRFGSDPRKYLVTTERFVSDESNHVKALEISKINPQAPKDKKSKTHDFIVKADLVLLAMGFLGPEEKIAKHCNIETDERSNLKAPYGKFTTNLAGVFSAGDCRRGQSLVVWAINEGRAVAREVDIYLEGKSQLP